MDGCSLITNDNHADNHANKLLFNNLFSTKSVKHSLNFRNHSIVSGGTGVYALKTGHEVGTGPE